MKDRLRILLDCRMATWTGVGRYSTGLARALAARDDVHVIQVVAANEVPPVSSQVPAEVVRAKTHPFGAAGAFELGRIARDVKPDLTHCLHFPTPFPASHPLVVTVHDLTPVMMPQVMPSALKRFVYHRWNARVAHVADRILANSLCTAEDFVKHFPAADAKLTVVPHAVDDFTTGPVGSVPAAFGLLDGESYLLSMGNPKPNKDLPTLLRAFARISHERLGLRLLLVGREVPGFVASVIDDERVASRVAFTGRVDDAALRALYAEASAFVFPSTYEGFGLPPLEAMTFGTPVVSSNAASLPEVVGDAGIMFEAGNDDALARAIMRVLDEPALRDRLSALGPKRAARFTWEQTARMTVAVYREVV
jgi:alpha-1,3-rhamnosyl/mannosyltransferase